MEPLENFKKFECKQCGKCCSDFGDKKYLPLYEWDVEILKEEAENKKISLKIEPLKFFLDKKTGIVIVFLYGLMEEPCPFLEDLKCSIYEKRPLICRKFPLGYTPRFAPEKFVLDCFYNCPNFNAKDFMKKLGGWEEKDFEEKTGEARKFNTLETDPIFKKVFGDGVDECQRENTAEMFIGMSLSRLKEGELIKYRKVSKFDVNKYRQMSLFDFLILKDLMNEPTKRKLYEVYTNQESYNQFLKNGFNM